MKKKIELAILIFLIASLAVLNRNLEEQVSSDKITVQKNTVVLDAGHGGGDPGKVGVGDVVEKEINLQIAKKVKQLLKKEKVKVIMTREADTMLAGEESTGTKVADMKERVRIINEEAPQLAVSIHQNSYQDAVVHGAQVFYYSGSSEGENAAKIMQNALLSIDEDNTRQAKANDTYYLLKRTDVPTIIVECGFLSNAEDAENLCNEEYQDKVAEAICDGILKIIGKENGV
ncbi:N-acetylmuramoyl-L-alanine amidase [Lachnospiraceae bacterium MD308]|nr:N-acetylmuramoyl-L-alanine amidase [Lachnospiraceae bacterium MD308]MCI8581008.1 N-acetylmuramoyl-L-alanine amidase [Dorea sp.]